MSGAPPTRRGLPARPMQPREGPESPSGSSRPSPGDPSRERVLEIAHDLGFDLAGIAPWGPPPDAARFEAWLDEGRHGSMDYLERGRAAALDPPGAWPEGRSLLALGLGHSRDPVELPGGGRIARYAAGRDYHNLIGKRLRKLRRRLEAEGLARPGPGFVDATPLLERSHAAAAGLGFASKAANLLHPRFGPWFFLAELVLDVDVEPTSDAVPHGSCGTCTACIDACPTDAILEPGVVDSRLCISYATIEHRGLVPHEVREGLGPWAFGCDVCSEVCPWGSKAPDLAERFGLRPEFGPDAGAPGETLEGLLAWGERPAEGREALFAEAFRGSPLRRPGPDGIARNGAFALAGAPADRGREALLRALERAAEPLVRAAAAWSLARAHRGDHGVGAALDAALRNEPDEAAAQDMRTSLERS